MIQFSSVDVYLWLKQFGEIIKTSRISQVYRQGEKQICFALHTKQGKKFLTIVVPNYISFSDQKSDADHKETGLGTWLRGNISGLIIQDIEQVRSERIIKLTTREYLIYIELFNKGNIIITDHANKIVMTMYKMNTTTIHVEKNEQYTIPESFDSFHASVKEILEKQKASEDNISRFLATSCGFGGAHAKTICENLGVELTTPAKEISADKIVASISQLLSTNKDFSNIDSLLQQSVSEERKKAYEKEIEKIQKIIDEQQKSKIRVEKDSEDEQKKGEFIYENYAFFDEAVKLYQTNKASQEAITALAKKHGIKRKITYKKPELVLEEI